MQKIASTLLVATLIFFLGCSFKPASTEQNKESSSKLATALAIANPEEKPSATPSFVTTFSDALRITKERSPQIKSYQALIDSKRALVKQANALNKNPEIILQPENFGGDLNGFSHSETALLLSKTLETGGKSERRVALAKAEQELQQLQTDIAMAELYVQLRKAYSKLQAAQELRTLTQAQLKISERQVEASQKRVALGGVRTSELSKAKVVDETAKLELRKADDEILLARKQLAGFWGGSDKDIKIQTELAESAIPAPEVSNERIENSLKFNESLLDLAVKKCKVAVEEANGYPDVRASIGVRRLQDTQENTLVGELAVPLPIFDTNAGAIDSAKAEAASALYQAEQQKIEISSKVVELQQTLLSLTSEYQSLKNTILKESKTSFEEAKQAYELGKASFFELLDAQRTLSGTERRTIETRIKIEEAKLDLFATLLDHPVNFDGDFLP